MLRLMLLKFCLLITIVVTANTIVVKNIKELQAANANARPGDIIILQNGEWKDVIIKLNCIGTKAQPITFKAQTEGKVLITGMSQLRLGGSFIIVDGLDFSNGYAGKDPVINFRINNEQLANNCRVTNTTVNDFNNPKRMDENYWVAFYGKNNRLDHCSFIDKKNMGVLLAVILDDERSRENFHSIDHNYFGRRPALASNGGEIIRVGVSQHCEFNSNTQITDNYFEHCDGETEIVSIKSGQNVVRGNVFKESQGGVVLRHGNYNIVENNIFLGNGKEGTGGVRVINKGQWVVNNFFYQCRGIDFRSPLSIMNGIPNSPAHRYVQVTEAVIANNTFYDCSPVSFGEGSDAERTLPPSNVLFINNIFYNNSDSIIYKVFDDISGINFWGNEVSRAVRQQVVNGFYKTSFALQKNLVAPLPVTRTKGTVQFPDSIRQAAQERLQHPLSTRPGFADIQILKKLYVNATQATGAARFKKTSSTPTAKPVLVKCTNAEEIYKQLERKEPAIIQLTGSSYTLNKPFLITNYVQFTSNKKNQVTFTTGNLLSVFIIAGSGHLTLHNLSINGKNVKATHFISSDSSGSSHHYNLDIQHTTIQDLSRENGCDNIFYAFKSIVADSIVIRNSNFSGNATNGILLSEETDNKGYYGAEKIFIENNQFNSQTGKLLDIYRGGNDESTMGPLLSFTSNKMINCSTKNDDPLIRLYGTQRSLLRKNLFTNCNAGKTLVRFEDIVRAAHTFKDNTLNQSGKIVANKFVRSDNNLIY